MHITVPKKITNKNAVKIYFIQFLKVKTLIKYIFMWTICIEILKSNKAIDNVHNIFGLYMTANQFSKTVAHCLFRIKHLND